MMEQLARRTTILLTSELHDRMRRLARSRGRSLGDLVREACEEKYGSSGPEARLAAVRALGRLALPVASPAKMKRESTPEAERLGQ